MGRGQRVPQSFSLFSVLPNSNITPRWPGTLTCRAPRRFHLQPGTIDPIWAWTYLGTACSWSHVLGAASCGVRLCVDTYGFAASCGVRLCVDTYGFAGMVEPRIRALYPALLTDAATVGTAAELLRTTRSGRETPRSWR